MKKRVLRWYDYSWSRGRIQGGGDINTALGLLPDKLKTELALHVNLSVLKKVTIFQECQPEFLHDLVLKMKAYIFTPGTNNHLHLFISNAIKLYYKYILFYR